MEGSITFFFENKIYVNEEKKVEIDFFNLDSIYDMSVSENEINKFIDENDEKLKVDYIDFAYSKIKPGDLIQIDDFNEEFFKKIDEIENSILNGESLNQIGKKYNLNIKIKNNYIDDNEKDDVLKSIYAARNVEKIQFIDKNNYFLLFEIKKINKILPNKLDEKFIELVKNNILLQKKINLNQEIYKKIQDKKLDDDQFLKIAKDSTNIKTTIIQNVNDINTFTNDSVKLIYSLPTNNFLLITDGDGKVYLSKIKKINSNSISKNDPKIKDLEIKSNNNIINDIYTSYDASLNTKYKVKIFNSTMDRVKNYFQ